MVTMEEMKRQLEDEDLKLEQKISLLNDGINKALTTAGVHTDNSMLTHVKTQLYVSGILGHCVCVFSLDPKRLHGNWSAATTLAQLTSTCCVGVEPGKHSETFHRLFLPSVMDGLLSLASQLMRRAECTSLFRKVMDSVSWLLRAHTQLATQVLSSVNYEEIQMCDDAAVSLLCVQLWIQACMASSNFVSRLSNDFVLLLLNEAVGQLVVSSDSAVGGASVRLILAMANQEQLRISSLLLGFRGLDHLLDKDWRGRGFDQEVNQLIRFIQSIENTTSCQASAEHVKAACVIQAAWRSYKTRRRVKSLNQAVSTLQRRYRARVRQQQQQREAEQWEEDLKYQVHLRRLQARREFHQRQRQLLQLLPPDHVQEYLQECERRAAVVIQSFWRGFKERQRYNLRHRNTLRDTQKQQQAARTLQRAVRHFLQKRRAQKAPPLPTFWIGQKGLTEGRRTELKKQVEEYIFYQPSSHVSREECERLHEEAQLLLMLKLQKGNHQRREEERIEALLAHIHTQLDLLRDAPLLSTVTESDAESFLSPSGRIAACAREAHNVFLQASRLPWWKTLGETTDVDTPPPPAYVQEKEAELGRLCTGGSAGVRKHTEVDRQTFKPVNLI